ncbi:MAG: NAD(P)-dependent oxidoreductase [Hyphomicrobiaceae bacterium]|nr:NAD(P)-dependent oxidoreductase [Hyphomicrobiaceae bacterium]
MDIRTIAFVGLGVMGEAMCRNLARKGSWRIIGFDTRAEPLARLAADGVMRSETLAEACAAADCVIMCLPGGAEVEAVTRGPGGLLELVRPGQTVVDMSTAPPRLMRELAAAFSAKGVDFADAPVARTRRAAVDGTLCIMVGATPEVFSRIRPILATMGTEIPHCGSVGAGQVVKIMNNMVVFETTLAIAEAISIAEAAGVDGRILYDTMSKGSADSFVLRNHGMKHLLPQDYPEQAFSVRYAIKDLSYARELARETGVVARGAELMHEIFEDAVRRGDGDLYTPVIRRGMEPSRK